MKNIFVQNWQTSAEAQAAPVTECKLLDSESNQAALYHSLIEQKSSAFMAGSGDSSFVYDRAVIFEHLKYRDIFQSMLKQSTATEPQNMDMPELTIDHAIIFRRVNNRLSKNFFGKKVPVPAAGDSINGSLENKEVIAKSVREGILVVENFISKEECEMLMNYTRSQSGITAEVVDAANSTAEYIKTIKHKARVAEFSMIDGMVYEILNIFNDVYCRRLAAFYNVDFEWYERPIILRYSPGGKYEAHTDTGIWNKEKKEWVRNLDRDYSVLLYLNEEFEGGELEFTRQKYKITPKAGMLVAFPSHQFYKHAALPVISGMRYAIVSWSAIVGSPRMRKMPPVSIYLKQKRLPT